MAPLPKHFESLRRKELKDEYSRFLVSAQILRE
jgi:hypothetical protein